MQPDNDVKVTRERSPVEQHLFTVLDLSPSEQTIIHDLARHAAEKAIESAKIVAVSVPDPDMIELVFISSLLLIGQAANQKVKANAELALSLLGEESREKVESLIREQRGSSMVVGVRDFDGKRS